MISAALVGGCLPLLSGCAQAPVDPQAPQVARAREDARGRLNAELARVTAWPGAGARSQSFERQRCASKSGRVDILGGGRDVPFRHQCTIQVTRFVAGPAGGAASLRELDTWLVGQGYLRHPASVSTLDDAAARWPWGATDRWVRVDYQKGPDTLSLTGASTGNGGGEALNENAALWKNAQGQTTFEESNLRAVTWEELGSPVVAFRISLEAVYFQD